MIFLKGLKTKNQIVMLEDIDNKEISKNPSRNGEIG